MRDPAAVIGAVFVLLLVFPPDVRAADDHLLDPILSLTGGTGTSTLDPVPDPGLAHPKKPFNDPCGVATDAYGNIFVANGALGTQHSEEGEVIYDGNVDVFSPTGEFLTEIPNARAPCSIAVNSAGQLYVYELGGFNVVRFDPVVYEPASGEIEYASTPILIAAGVAGLGLDPQTDNLYVAHLSEESKFRIDQWAPDGTLTDSFTEGEVGDPRGVAVGPNHDLYLTGDPWEPEYDPFNGLVGVLDATTHAAKLTLEGFGFTFGRGGIAADHANGDIYVDDIAVDHLVRRFDAEGNEIGQLSLPANALKAAELFSGIAVDRGAHSPNQGYVYVTSGSLASNSHLYAFAPPSVQPPEVRGVRIEDVGEDEALLTGEVNPHGVATAYRFEFGPESCAAGGCQSVPVPEGSAGAGGTFISVTVPLAGLNAHSTYHVRLVATSPCNPAEPSEGCVVESSDATFTTFPSPPPQNCPNAALRTGPSAELADCRAYELVTPVDTGGRIPTGAVFGSGPTESMPVLLAREDVEGVAFGTEGGTIPGSGGSGRYDTYEATRGSSGWSTSLSGLSGEQANESYPITTSADHRYSLWLVSDENGSLAPGYYLRGPGGAVEFVGIGSAAVDPFAAGRWIDAGTGRLVLTSDMQLAQGAPPSGTEAIYERYPGGIAQIVSLLPGEVPLTGGESAEYLGTARQGGAVVFRAGGSLYIRTTAAETVKVIEGAVAYGGVSVVGDRVFYVREGDVFAFDVSSKTTTPVGSGGESTMVNVSADGSHVYFVSPSVLTGTEANSEGEKAISGGQNLYVWSAADETVRFVATVEEEDVVGEPPPPGGANTPVGGLGMWIGDAVDPAQSRFRGPANDPSRTSADGTVFVFESRARLTDYDNQGRREVYRYVVGTGELRCVSCSPTGAPAVADAQLESRYAPLLSSVPPVNAISQVQNIAQGGEIVFFQSAERLSAQDTDGQLDVYEWKAPGAAGCARVRGCTILISSGRSAGNDYLYGATPDGSTVFFFTADTLVAADRDATPSIYAARIGGGFPPLPSQPAACLGEACQPPGAVPGEVVPSSALPGPGNPKPSSKHCPRGRRRVKGRNGKAHCLRKSGKARRHGRGRAERGGER